MPSPAEVSAFLLIEAPLGNKFTVKVITSVACTTSMQLFASNAVEYLGIRVLVFWFEQKQCTGWSRKTFHIPIFGIPMDPVWSSAFGNTFSMT